MEQITLKNFRCFREEQVARLAPLTLLVGENSTGKTSFMALIRALWDVAYQASIPDFKEEPYDLGSFDEIAYYRGGRAGRADTFEAGFTLQSMEGEAYRFDVTFARNGTVPVPVKRRIALDDVWIEDYLENDLTRQVKFGTALGAWLGQSSSFVRVLPVTEHDQLSSLRFLFMDLQWIFSDLRRKVEGRESDAVITALQDTESFTEEDWERLEKLVMISEMRSIFETRPYASAPVRSKPRRTYDPARPTRDPEGDYIPMYFADAYFQNKRQWNALKNALEAFGKQSGLFDEISVEPLGRKDTGPFQVQIRKFGKRAKGPQRNLIDVGYGVSQVLPVITELLRRDVRRDEAMKRPRPQFLLQQPEVHLHPSAQAALGTLFCQLAGQYRQLIIETHSDHLIDRVRMDVRDSATNLRPEDVSILFFERGDLDVRIHSLRLDREGNVLNAPQSYRRFFMEETTRSLGL